MECRDRYLRSILLITKVALGKFGLHSLQQNRRHDLVSRSNSESIHLGSVLVNCSWPWLDKTYIRIIIRLQPQKTPKVTSLASFQNTSTTNIP